MPLHPQAKTFLDLMNNSGSGTIGDISIEQMRDMAAFPMGASEQLEVGEVRNMMIAGPASEVPLRIYRPVGDGVFPLLVFFHGGGFVSCGLDTHDDLCRMLCLKLSAVVVSVDYRLAPEHKFPAAPMDCYAATCWAAENAAELGGDSSRMAVAGDSAGGNLAAVVCHMVRDRGGPPLRHQLLLYPVTSNGMDFPSYKENEDGYFLSADGMAWCWNHYLSRPEEGRNLLASPLRAENFTGLPAATVLTAEYDPLRDEGEAYADRLSAAGVDVMKKRYAGMIHGFVSLRAMMDTAGEAIDDITARLGPALAG